MVRIRRKLDSDTLHLPELKSLIGRAVEIAIRLVVPCRSCYDVEKEGRP